MIIQNELSNFWPNNLTFLVFRLYFCIHASLTSYHSCGKFGLGFLIHFVSHINQKPSINLLISSAAKVFIFNLPNFHQLYLYGLLLAAWASVVNYEFSKLSSCHFPILSGSKVNTYCSKSGCCISLLESSVTSHTNYTNFAHPPISYLWVLKP